MPAVDLARHWSLDPAIAYLNHGSFGACPAPILAAQHEWQRRLEREPVLFLHREIERHLDAARGALGTFLGARPEDIALVPNATAGVNSVLRSLTFAPGDELLTTDQEYNASRNALDFVARQCGATVVVAKVPFPLASPDIVLERILAQVTPRTRLALVDHIQSPTGLLFPIEQIVRELAARGVDTLVDGAHGPGQVALDLEQLGAAYYTGNCHKWLCTPKGSALLWVRRDRQAAIRPLAISHGANSRRTDRSRFLLEFDWPGTFDPTPWLVIPLALQFLAGLVPGGFDEIRRRNHALVLEGRRLLLEAVPQPEPCPESMVGSLAAIVLPDQPEPGAAPLGLDPLQLRLFERHQIELPLPLWPAPPRRLLRISAQLYNRREQYQRLATVVAGELAQERAGTKEQRH
ncbi:MAG: aminotransferase class V-fold PLP-dependent enzyme [Myxococcales bacterium]|nr:aminotransferase class V-fold PLP-dependent enzyme [Myxococcales bacterium]